MKKYPSFETWIAGSPHDSDEYDTDLDIDDFVKSKFYFLFMYIDGKYLISIVKFT